MSDRVDPDRTRAIDRLVVTVASPIALLVDASALCRSRHDPRFYRLTSHADRRLWVRTPFGTVATLPQHLEVIARCCTTEDATIPSRLDQCQGTAGHDGNTAVTGSVITYPRTETTMSDRFPEGVDVGAMRHIAANPERWPTAGPQLLNDAADEVERLRGERDQAALEATLRTGDCDDAITRNVGTQKELDEARAEVDRLRASLHDAETDYAKAWTRLQAIEAWARDAGHHEECRAEKVQPGTLELGRCTCGRDDLELDGDTDG